MSQLSRPEKFDVVRSSDTDPFDISFHSFNAWFDDTHVLKDVGTNLPDQGVTCIVGPTGAGKSTLIRSINRINDDEEQFSCSGTITFRGQNLYADDTNVDDLRTRIGMVFQKPCVFPTTIEENVLFGAKHHNDYSAAEQRTLVEETLKSVSLWEATSHRLDRSATDLSVGQQQKLSIARTLAVKPEVLLLDEPTASLDPQSTRAVESLIRELQEEYPVVVVTHNIRQAKAIADYLIFMCEGRVIESGPARKLIEQPEHDQTRNYLKNERCDCR